MCGVPGSGKTTWARNILNDAGELPIYYVSRDEIRFSLLENEDEYFAKENEVFSEWIHTLQSYLNKNEDCYIIADATHLNERSRNKTLDRLILNDTKILIAVANPGIQECLRRNDLRKGRQRVPHSALRRMYATFEMPTMQEKYKYESILMIKKG